MPVGVHHRGPEAHREPAKKSLEDREILGHSCGIYPRISRALRLIRGVGGTRGRLSESDPSWAANGVARHRTRRGSTWVDHVRSEWHVTGTSVTWDFRGGDRATCQGKSRGDGWDHYILGLWLFCPFATLVAIWGRQLPVDFMNCEVSGDSYLWLEFGRLGSQLLCCLV